METISFKAKTYTLLLVITVLMLFWQEAAGHKHGTRTQMTLGLEFLFSWWDSAFGDATAGIPAELFIQNNLDKVGLD